MNFLTILSRTVWRSFSFDLCNISSKVVYSAPHIMRRQVLRTLERLVFLSCSVSRQSHADTPSVRTLSTVFEGHQTYVSFGTESLQPSYNPHAFLMIYLVLEMVLRSDLNWNPTIFMSSTTSISWPPDCISGVKSNFFILENSKIWVFCWLQLIKLC